MKPISHDDGVPRGHAGQHHSLEELHNEYVAHEHSDINIRAIIGAAVAMVVITAVVSGLMVITFRVLEGQAKANDPEMSPLAVPATKMPAHVKGPAPFGTAPKPQLLTNEEAVLQQHRAQENQQLSGYGWVNEQGGIARMPIAEAKKLLLERGLPVRPAGAATDPSVGTNRPSGADASSGRTADGPPRGAGVPEIGVLPSSPKQPATGAPTPHKGGGSQ